MEGVNVRATIIEPLALLSKVNAPATLCSSYLAMAAPGSSRAPVRAVGRLPRKIADRRRTA
jgi:hypothetical protein